MWRNYKKGIWLDSQKKTQNKTKQQQKKKPD